MNITFVRQRMKELDIGNEELSNRSGVPLGTLNKILAGTSTSPHLNTLEALATALDCTIEDFSDRAKKNKASMEVQEKVSEIADLMMRLSAEDLALAKDILQLIAKHAKR